MQDKNKIIRIYSDTKLDMALINKLVKVRQMNTDDLDEGVEPTRPQTTSKNLKIMIVPRDN